MFFKEIKVKNAKDIRTEIKPQHQNKIFLLNSFYRDELKKNGDNLNIISFPIKNEKKEDNIYIFTDGSVKAEKFQTSVYEKVKIKTKRKTLVRSLKTEKNEVLNEIYGYGTLIQTKEKEITTMGVATNYDVKHGKSQNSNVIELKAIEEALLNLINNIQNLENRNIYLYSDNINNLIAINHEIKSRSLKDKGDKFISSKKEESISKLKIKQYIHNNSLENYNSIQRIADIILKYKININWIKSHQNYLQNEIVDKLASQAVEFEKQNHFNNTSRIDNLYSVHSFTKIHSKNYDKKQDHKKEDEIIIHQKFHDGKIVFSENEKEISLDYQNHTKIQTRISNNTYIVKTETNIPRKEEKVIGFDKVDINKIKLELLQKNNILLSRIITSNVSSMLNILQEESQLEQKIKIILNVQQPKISCDNSENFTLINYFNEFDNSFNLNKNFFKNIESFNFKINSLNLILPYIKNENIIYLKSNFLTQKEIEDKQNSIILKAIKKNENNDLLLDKLDKALEKSKTINPISSMINWKRNKSNI